MSIACRLYISDQTSISILNGNYFSGMIENTYFLSLKYFHPSPGDLLFTRFFFYVALHITLHLTSKLALQWFNGMIFVQPTKDSKLRKGIQKCAQHNKQSQSKSSRESRNNHKK